MNITNWTDYTTICGNLKLTYSKYKSRGGEKWTGIFFPLLASHGKNEFNGVVLEDKIWPYFSIKQQQIKS